MFKYFFELKTRLVYLLVTCIATFITAFFYKESLLYFLVKFSTFQLKNELPYFIYTNLTEVFITYIKLSALTSVYITMPFFICHLWFFISPGLYTNEYYKIRKLVSFFILIWLINTFLIYNYILPSLWGFFTGFETNAFDSPLSLHFEAKLNEYLDFVVSIFFFCGINTQIFLCFVLFSLSSRDHNLVFITKFRRYMYVLTFLFAALITPPDFISQIVVAMPIITTYEAFIVLFLFKNELIFIIRSKIA